ncbi:SDR family oxidoreductase [Thermus thalpophilus]|uniref:SDR family oxidoreductase n=1 Tax=Thermus thalpophilus TaxID=2908147 RepID=UPI001FA9FA47|nr:SDR family oxidoreductase [Thermus thalpophilus]
MRVAVLTGASSGMGFAVARRLGAEGYTLVVNSRDPAQAVRRLEAAGYKAVGVAGDLKEEGTARRLVEVAERIGRLDALLLNHGGPPVKAFMEVGEEEWREWFERMVVGPLRLLRLAVPLFRRGGGGRVVAITSFTVKSPYPGIVLSNALRAALVNALKTAALELGREGILINAVAPGYILTERIAEWNRGQAAREGVGVEEVAARTTGSIPLGRYGKAEEVAEVVAFLLSERNGYVTGQQVLVDGGYVVAT